MKSIDLSKVTIEEDNKRLRGSRINKIKKDLKDKDMGLKRKMLTYSDHLSWCLKTFERIAAMQQSANQPGIWDKNSYSHGVLNGMIMAMAVIVEEQGDIPFQKAPMKYRQTESEWFNENVFNHIEKLESKVIEIIMANKKGPKGYEEAAVPFQAWAQDALQVLATAPVKTTKMANLRDEVNEYISEELKNK